MQDAPEPEWLRLHRAIEAVDDEDAAAAYDERAVIVRWREQAGLSVDDAVIEDLLSRGGAVLAHPGMWETVAEAERRQRGEAVIAESADAVEAYVRAHEDGHAGSWIEWNDAEPTFVVAFVDDPARHADALKFPGVRVTRHARTLRELQPIAEDVVLGQFAGEVPAGTVWPTAGVNEPDNVVDVVGMGPYERAAADWLAQRYGDRVRLIWWGSAEPRVAPMSWQVWDASPEDPRVLTVHWKTNSEHRFERLEIDRRRDRIRVTVFEAAPAGVTSMAAAYRFAEVRLDAPLGTRAVIDAVSGRPRPRL